MCQLFYFCLKVDQQTTQARKYQRNNEDLQAQIDNLRLQIDHLQNRYV